MQAILYIGHGTRHSKGVLQCVEFIRKVKQRVKVPIQEIAFLEIVEPTIEVGVRRCVERGATSIAIMPLLLLTAHHANLDIPQELKEVQMRYPHIQFTYGKPLGIEQEMIETVVEQVDQAVAKAARSVLLESDLRQGEADVLLIVRGSSDIGLAQQAEEICQQVSNLSGYIQVKPCYLYGAGWRFEEALESYRVSDRAVVIVPYLLFDGLLSVGIEKKIAAAQIDNASIILGEKLGHGDKVQKVLLRRVEQCLQTEGVFV